MRYIVFFTITLFVWSCKTKSGIPEGCDTVGTVKDYTGLDGCGLLIELENGDLFNPVTIKGDFQLQNGQVISFGYKKLEDVMSICMREKAQVEISCVVELSKKPDLTICVDTENPFEVGWMDKAIDLHNPNQVLKYKSGQNWMYLFRSIPNSYLYDCQGKLICETKNDHDKCQMDKIDPLGQGRVIWQGEGVWD